MVKDMQPCSPPIPSPSPRPHPCHPPYGPIQTGAQMQTITVHPSIHHSSIPPYSLSSRSHICIVLSTIRHSIITNKSILTYLSPSHSYARIVDTASGSSQTCPALHIHVTTAHCAVISTQPRQQHGPPQTFAADNSQIDPAHTAFDTIHTLLNITRDRYVLPLVASTKECLQLRAR